MAVSTRVHQMIRERKFDELEDHWLTMMSEEPEDVSSFVGIARALAGSGEEDRARTLLELWDDQLRSDERWPTRLQMLQQAGALLLKTGRIHPALLATLRAHYAHLPSLEGLIEVVGLNKGVDDIDKSWNKVKRLESLLTYDEGAVVEMKGKGVGRVVEVNMQLESFKITLELHPDVRIGFSAASKMLSPLDTDHILHRKLSDRDELERIAKEDPSELLRLVLASYDESMAAGAIREVVAGIVTEKRWTSWWSAARKHDQVMSTGSGARQRYSWASSGEDATAAIQQRFDAADIDEKLQLFRQNAARDAELKEQMTESLRAAAGRAAPSTALAIWFALEKTGGVDGSEGWSPTRLLTDSAATEAARLVAGVGTRALRERGYAMVREEREDWAEVFAASLAHEADDKSLDTLADALAEGDPAALDSFFGEAMSTPRKLPAAFVWTAERSATDEAIRKRNPARLLQQVLAAVGDDPFAKYKNRVQALFESGHAVPKLILELEESHAEKVVDAIRRSRLDEDQQRSLINGMETRFASLRADSVSQAGLYATRDAIEARKVEYKNLKEVEIPANRQAIQEARELGDLRENFEYKSARQRHEYLSARLTRLDNELNRVQPIVFDGLDTSTVRIGCRVALEGDDGGQTLTILGPWESSPEDGVISYESDLAGALLGKAVGDQVEVSGGTRRIRSIDVAS